MVNKSKYLKDYLSFIGELSHGTRTARLQISRSACSKPRRRLAQFHFGRGFGAIFTTARTDPQI